MGGGHYDGDVGTRSRASQTENEVFDSSGYQPDGAGSERREVDPDLNIKGLDRECRDNDDNPKTTPIVAAMDVTRSRGDDAKVIYGKMPMFIGQIRMKDYVPSPILCTAAVGDATSGDQAPIQVAQFEADNRIDEQLAKMWLEEGGGGTGEESYELMAYYFARHSKLDATARGKKGYFFFLGDEAPYPFVAKDQIKTYIGDDVPDNIPTEVIMQELMRLYHVFLIYPQKSWEERKSDIDEEIKKRVTAAGGQYDDVDVRISLIWNNRNDLDLHVFAPSGQEIWYQKKQSNCGGWLDVDQNVRGETMKPVENIRWKKGQAPSGHYKVVVQNYGCHGGFKAETPFKIEIEVNGVVQHFEGKTPAGKTGGESNVTVHEFDFDPSARPVETEQYAGYKDEVVKEKWRKYLPDDHILVIEDPKGIVDVMLGAMAITEQSRDLDAYLVDMAGRGQTALRQGDTKKALTGLADSTALVKVSTSGTLPVKGKKKKKGGKSKRL